MTSPYSLSRPGGVQGQVLGLARELRHLGVDVRVVAPCDGPPPAPGVVCVGPSVEWISNGSVAPIAADGSAARRTAEAIRSIEPHLVHLHEPAVPGPCLSTLIGFNGPMVGTFHASGELLHQWSRPAMRRSMSRLTTRVVVSEAARDTARAELGRRVRRALERHRGRPVRERDADAVAGAGGVLRRPARAAQRLGAAARRVVAHSTATRCCGSASTGPQTKELRKRKVANVEWLGSISDPELEQRMRGATVFCAPSLHGESFGVVLLEAMAAGTPIVASAIEGYENVARPGREALLVEPGEVDDLGDALRRALDDAALRDATRRRPGGRVPRSSRWPDSPSATSSSTRKRSSPRREHDCTRSVSEIEQLALETAARVRDAVAPSLGDPGARERRRCRTRRRRHDGDRRDRRSRWSQQCLAAAGDIAYYSEDRGYVAYRRSARDLRRRPGRRHPAGRGRARVLLRVDRGRAALGSTRRSATCQFGVVHEIKSGDRFFASRGAACAPSVPTVARSRSRSSENTDLGALFWTAGLRGRPVVPVSIALEDVDRRLVDAGRLLRPRLRHVQHDAHRDRAARRVRRHRAPPRRRAAELEAAFPARRRGRGLHELPVRRRGRRR